MNKTEIMESHGFARWCAWKNYDPECIVTQVANESQNPIRGRQLRSDGTFPWATRVAPTRELAQAAIDGSLFEDATDMD